MTPKDLRRRFTGARIAVGALLVCAPVIGACTGTMEELPGETRPGQGANSGTPGKPSPGMNGGGAPSPAPGGGDAPASGIGAGGGALGCNVDLTAAPPQRIRRLTNQEYENVVADAVGKRVDVSGLSADTQVGGMVNDATSLIVTGTRFDEYASLATRIATAEAERVAACKTGEAGRDCARRFVTGFGRRLFGRPLATEESESLVGPNGIYDKGQSPGGHKGGLVLVARALLMSPYFLYRTEIGEVSSGSGGVAQLNLYELASNVSFFLTGSRPDDELLLSAEQGKLGNPTELAKQAQRLAQTPRGQQRLRAFLMGWLGVSELEKVEKDDAVFPELTDSLKLAMKREVEAFIDHVLAQNGTLEELLTGAYTFPNAELASKIYKTELTGTAGDFTRVAVDSRRRKGVISLAGFLAGHSSARHSGPVERGVFVRAKLMCLPQPPVPANIPIAAIEQGAPGKTTRAQFEQHEAEPACQACHKLFDPIGFGLEMMDGIGRFRTTENGVTVDSSGGMPADADVQGKFAGPAELSTLLAGSAQVRGCVAVNSLRFADGVVADALGSCEKQKAAESFSAAGKRIVDLWVALAQRPSMAVRRVSP